MRSLRLVVTDEQADLELLSLANEKGKFALQLGLTPEEPLQYAFERGIDGEWFTLVDVSTVAIYPHAGLFRCFRLTEKGWARLRELRASAGGAA
jgi:hypothetical protein